jgi:hypothetical protein
MCIDASEILLLVVPYSMFDVSSTVCASDPVLKSKTQQSASVTRRELKA